MSSLLWMQTGSCSGDTMSLLTADGPSIESLVRSGRIELYGHPSLSARPAGHFARLVEEIESGRRKHWERSVIGLSQAVAEALPAARARLIELLS